MNLSRVLLPQLALQQIIALHHGVEVQGAQLSLPQQGLHLGSGDLQQHARQQITLGVGGNQSFKQRFHSYGEGSY